MLSPLWDSLADYNAETTPGDTQENAVAALLYDDDGDIWPDSNNSGSVSLSTLNADTTNGLSWLLSNEFDGVSFQVALGSTNLHPGGDVGSPGSFSAAPVADVDADNDGDIDGADFLLLQQTNPSLIADWIAQYPASASLAAAAVPEPTSVALIGLALAAMPLIRRK